MNQGFSDWSGLSLLLLAIAFIVLIMMIIQSGTSPIDLIGQVWKFIQDLIRGRRPD